MPKPKSKKELLAASQKNYATLIMLVNGYTKEDLAKEFPPGTMNRNIRDVLAHIHHWHLMLLDWYTVGMKGEKPEMPAKGYTWRTLPALNQEIWQKYQASNLASIKEHLNESYKDVQELITKHTDQELFEKKRYHWTGSTSLGVYFISNTSSHYNWATQLIKKSMKKLKTTTNK